ncbi:hypothetical protein [Lacrimispora amygdalina]|nr:hypothetical protein [Lacrimispora amygdalina]
MTEQSWKQGGVRLTGTGSGQQSRAGSQGLVGKPELVPVSRSGSRAMVQ